MPKQSAARRQEQAPPPVIRRAPRAPSVASRMSALRDFAALPDETRINTTELGLLLGKSPEAVRIDLRTGKLAIPLAPEAQAEGVRKLSFVLGVVRSKLRVTA